MDNLILSAPARINAAGKPRRVAIMAYAGGLMTVPGWGKILIDLAGLELPDSLPVLSDHANELAAVAGSAAPEVKGGALILAGTLADVAAGQHVVALLGAGVKLQASVGLEPLQTTKLAAGTEVTLNGRLHTVPPGGATLVSKGRLREVSLVAVGADPASDVTLMAKHGRTSTVVPTGLTMPDENITTSTAANSGDTETRPLICKPSGTARAQSLT